jgi:prolipoprotein diacylglyceryltransferase
LIVYRMKPKDGVVAWTWFTLYGITRSVAELWRQADFTALGLTGGQLYALPMIVVGIVGVAYCVTRPGARTEARTTSARQ